MKREYVSISVLVIVIVCVYISPGLYEYLKQQTPSTVCINGICFVVEVATTPESRARGLMFRESMDNDRGMLFIYDQEGIYQFWMKNTLIPLDMIWISEDKNIVNIKKRAQPCQPGYCPTINPGAEALYVLEINAGFSDRFGFEVGDDVEINIMLPP